jgi:putative DNA primase/helicase
MKPIYTLEKVGNPVLDGYRPSVPSTSAQSRLHLTENESMSDFGNAQRFIHLYGNRVFYCSAECTWYIWDGRVWKSDAQNQIEVFAQNTARSIFDEVKFIQDIKYKSALQRWGRGSLNHARYSKMLKVASSHLPASLEQFDTDKWLLGVDNGVINLRTGELLPPKREYMISKLCSIGYDPAAKCPRWTRFIEEIFAGDFDLIRFVKKMVGYWLTGIVGEKCFFLLLGASGDNGKTVFINTLMMLLGDYGLNMPMDSLLQRKPGAQSNDIVRLKGARFISCSEANKKYYFDEALVKRLTGNDPVTARALYKEHITFQPEGKIVIGTNQVPRFDKEDTAFDKRIRQIPFNVTFVGDAKDEKLEETLRGELEGILVWAVEGCLLWQQEGLGTVPASESIRYEVRPPSSCLDNFIETRCELADNAQCKSSELYEAYLKYQQESAEGTEPLSNSVFCIELGKLGIIATHHRDGNYRAGISLRENSTSEPIVTSE